MSLKEQFEKIKENWLLILIVVFIFGVMIYLPNSGSIGFSSQNKMAMDYAYESSLAYGGSYDTYKNYTQNFAPQVENRKIVKTANLGLETKVGKFSEVDSKLREVIKSSDSFILNENIYSNKVNSREIFSGNYVIKVNNDKLEYITNQLKDLGKVTRFTMGADDVTGQYTNVNIELQVERERLLRYQEMYEDAELINDKIELNDRIFNQERTIKYLEDSVRDIDQRIDYSTINLTVNEKSDYLGIAFVKLSDLVRSFINSLNSLIRLVVLILPWVIIIGFFYAINRFFKKEGTKVRKK